MKATVFLGLFLGFALQEPPASMTFVAPKDAKPADVAKAAISIELRCEAFGYKGVKAKVVDSGIQVTCPTGITSKMAPNIERLSRIPAAKVEMRFTYPLDERAKEQFEPGTTCPDDGEWLKESDSWLLVLKSPRILVTGKMTWVHVDENAVKATDGVQGSYYRFDEKSSGKIVDLTDRLRRCAVLFVDDYRIDSRGTLKCAGDQKKPTVLWETASSRTDQILGICINNPMPIALEVKK